MGDEKRLYKTCRRCGRKLKSRESRLVGFGPVCYRKYLESQRKSRLFELKVYKKDKNSI